MNPKIHTPFSLEVLEEKLAQKSKAKEKLPPPEKMARKAGGQGKRFDESDFQGKQFGFLTPLGKSDSKSKYGIVWRFQCKCGNKVEKIAHRVFNGLTRSCGCYRPAQNGNIKHGLSRHYLYIQWCSIIDRCTNANNPRWSSYGGRGITLHPEWRRDPQKFLDYLGPRPSKNHTIDRIDNDKGYEPGNLRWADRKTQQRNRRTNAIIEFNGVKMCIVEWAERLGLQPKCLSTRIKRGWPLERALSPKSYKHGKRDHFIQQPSCHSIA
jgi:hypothetical protein